MVFRNVENQLCFSRSGVAWGTAWGFELKRDEIIYVK